MNNFFSLPPRTLSYSLSTTQIVYITPRSSHMEIVLLYIHSNTHCALVESINIIMKLIQPKLFFFSSTTHHINYCYWLSKEKKRINKFENISII